tara:strand:- start:739 stop:900 length:162 start_codon:yes stop_codon:yes gene_type:complete
MAVPHIIIQPEYLAMQVKVALRRNESEPDDFGINVSNLAKAFGGKPWLIYHDM